MDDGERRRKRAQLVAQKNAIREELREIDMETLAVELYEMIHCIRNQGVHVHDINLEAKCAGVSNGYLQSEDANRLIHSTRPGTSTVYMCVVMYRMLWNAQHSFCKCGECTKAYLDQIDKFATLRDGRVVGLNHRYAGGQIVPIDEC